MGPRVGRVSGPEGAEIDNVPAEPKVWEISFFDAFRGLPRAPLLPPCHKHAIRTTGWVREGW